MLLNILQDTGQPRTTKNDLTPDVNSAMVEKPWAEGGKYHGAKGRFQRKTCPVSGQCWKHLMEVKRGLLQTSLRIRSSPVPHALPPLLFHPCAWQSSISLICTLTRL